MSKPTQIFVNLPVKDLQKSKDFYTSLGFAINPQYSNDKMACMVFDNVIHVMLLTGELFTKYTGKKITNSKSESEVIVSITRENKSDVDRLVETALKAGGSIPREPVDHGFVYTWSFEDPDNHVWEVLWLEGNQ
jgi:predicted lactoylglutathione lyase